MSNTMTPGTVPGHEALSLTDRLRKGIGCGVIIVDAEEKIAACTDPAAHMLGLDAGEVLRKSINVLPAPLRKAIRRALTTGQPVTHPEAELSLTGRKKITVRLSAVPMQAGKIAAGVALVLNDLTWMASLEQNLRRLDRLASSGTLSASLAHEIKNALVAVKTFIDLLLEKNRDAELAEVVRREIGRMDALVSRLLKFAGPARPALSPIRLHQVLDNSLQLVRHQFEEKLIALNRSYAAASDLVKGDDQELEQTFVNLFLNALEAMGPNGTLTVATHLLSDDANGSRSRNTAHPQVRVTIKDTGVGIPPEILGRMFEPFFTTKQHGTGLGLPIAQRIIQQHHGAIHVESQPNHGATFSIFLPALDKNR
jgi:signal transduction histidine kinase